MVRGGRVLGALSARAGGRGGGDGRRRRGQGRRCRGVGSVVLLREDGHGC